MMTAGLVNHSSVWSKKRDFEPDMRRFSCGSSVCLFGPPLSNARDIPCRCWNGRSVKEADRMYRGLSSYAHKLAAARRRLRQCRKRLRQLDETITNLCEENRDLRERYDTDVDRLAAALIRSVSTPEAS